jgi:hypothetical protein
MTPEEMSAKMAALYEDEAFTAKAAACENTEQMAELFVKEGLPVTSDMLDVLLAKANEEELDEGALDNVAGGAIRWLPLPRCPFPLPIPTFPRWPRRF